MSRDRGRERRIADKFKRLKVMQEIGHRRDRRGDYRAGSQLQGRVDKL
jgi:hypothetical protein